MFLIDSRHEIAAFTGGKYPCTTKRFYDLTAYRDKNPTLSTLASTELSYIGMALFSLVETTIRIPITLISALFSMQNKQELEKAFEFSLRILAFSTYAIFLNLFVTNITSYLVSLDIWLRASNKEDLLSEACSVGHYQLAKNLLDKGANPHVILPANVTPALVPSLFGYQKLNSLFTFDNFEKDYFPLKEYSHWLSLTGKVQLHGTNLPLEGTPSRWLFDSLANAFERFCKTDDFDNLKLTPPKA
ncbi:unnamed protein product, partial [marine sediment metagenome]